MFHPKSFAKCSTASYPNTDRTEHSRGTAFKQFLYTPEGRVTILCFNSLSGQNEIVQDSSYTWRYFWRGGRASIDHAPLDPNNLGNPANIELYDGLVYFAGRGEHDTLTGAPVAEDVYAYVQALNLYSSRTAENTRLAGNGTTDTFAHPVGSGGWDTMWDAFWSPSKYGAMGNVTQPTWVNVTSKVAGWTSVVALTLATGGAYGGVAGALTGFGYLSAGVAAGAAGGAAYSNYTGSDFWSSVEVGANIGAVVGSFPGALRAAGTKFLQYGDEGAQGLLALFGRTPPPALAAVGGRTLAGAAGAESALAASAFAGARVNWGGLFVLGANAVFSLSRPWRGQFGADLNQPGLFPEAAVSEPIHGHHTWPMALGGHPKQRLSMLLESQHLGRQGVHAGLRSFEGGWLYPRVGRTGAQILRRHGEQAVVEGLRRFYSQPRWRHLLADFDEAVAFTKGARGVP